MHRRIDLPLQTRLAPIGSVDAKARTATLVWTTGARVKRFDWERGNYYLEELSLDPAHVRLLNSHNRFDLSGVIGVVESATLEKGEGRATVRFSEREDVEPIFRDVQSRILRNVSAGYVTHRIEMCAPDEASEGLPVYRAVDWEPMEISIVPIGADAGAGVRSGDSTKTYPCEFIETREGTMPNPTGDQPDNAVENVKPSAAELQRVRTIRELCRGNNISERSTEEFLTSGASVSEVRRAVLAIKAEISERTSISAVHNNAGGGDRDPRLNLISEALAARHYSAIKPSDGAREFMHMRILDIARFCLEARGLRTTTMSSMDIVKRAIYGAHGTSDFAELLTGTGSRILRASYQAHTSGITRVFRQTTAPDFRSKQVLALSEAPALLTVPAGGEYKQGTMAETKESYALATYGRIMGVNRQAMVNDDLDAFGTMFMKFGQAAAEKVASTLTTLVNSNPTLSTGNGGNAVFSTANGNLVTGTNAISVDTIGTGVKSMRLQQGISDNIVLGVGPKYLVVPAAMEQLAKQYTSANYTPAQASNINPWTPIIEPIVEPRLDALSSTRWYLFADPGLLSCFEYAYLEGEEGPVIESRQGWEVDGIEFKCRLDLGAGATEFRGCFRNGT
jgi:ribosomal protein S17E